jgi:enoyl-CoA hydratase/carnithine racemase
MMVIYEKHGHIVLIKISRPEVLNALNVETLSKLKESWINFNEDDDAWVAILTGDGEAFCVGADLKEIASLSPEERLRMKRPGGIHKGVEVLKPVIAAVNGKAYGGGCELALACDIRIASEKASFALTEVSVGLIPGGGGTQRLPRIVPLGVAFELLFTGRSVDANEALKIGLVNKVVPHESLMDESFSLAESICQRAPLAVRAAKEAVLKGLHMPLEYALRLETLFMHDLRQTEDAIEGPRAFAEKRKPKFKGR